MSKRVILWSIVALVCAGVGGFLLWSHFSTEGLPALTEKDMARAANKLRPQEAPTSTVAAPLDLKRPVRLAIGSLGLPDDESNRRLSDLLLADLTGAPGLNLVERQALDAVLREMSLGLSGLVRAKDAVRAGKLLQADWFLLGTGAKLSGTNAIVVRLVDARTGIFLDAGVFSAEKSPARMAADLAGFVRQSRQNAAAAKPRIYLAIGAFEDLSVNNRQAGFPTQLRGYLTAAYQGGTVTLLEREYVETLLQEVRLDLAGLTEEGGTNVPQPMQSAFWLVTGQYQSYETTNMQVELNLEVQRIFGTAKRFTVRGLPGEPVGRQIKSAIDSAMNRNTGVIVPTRMSEVRAELAVGKELLNLGNGYWDISMVPYEAELEAAELMRRHRNVEQAIRAFETVLLLDSQNREAKIYLAHCYRRIFVNRTDEALNYYLEILNAKVQDKWTGEAQLGLVDAFRWTPLEDKIAWFENEARNAANPTAADFFRRQVKDIRAGIILSGEGSEAQELAEAGLFSNITNSMLGNVIGYTGAEGFVKTFGTNQAAAAKRITELFPKFKAQAPELTPYLLAAVVTVQVETNAQVVVEFRHMLENYGLHPDQVYKPESFWQHISRPVYQWSFDHKLYSLAEILMEGKFRAFAGDFLLQNNHEEKMSLAFAYLYSGHWQKALKIFEGYSDRPIKIGNSGPWGPAFTVVSTAKWAEYCRKKLNLPVVRDSREFDMGKAIFCLHTPSTFVADENGLWIGICGQLLRLDYDMKTNLAINLPIEPSVPITTLCPTDTNIWIGTGGAGLVEFDKVTRRCRRLTESDGLMMDYVTSLYVAGGALWIGYGDRTGGGLGQLEMHSRKLKAFMPAMNANHSSNIEEEAPRYGVGNIVTGTDGELWLFVRGAIRQYNVARDAWRTLPNASGRLLYCFAADTERLIEGVGIEMQEVEVVTKPSRNAPTNEEAIITRTVTSPEWRDLRESINASIYSTNRNQLFQMIRSIRIIEPKGALAIQSLRDRRWQNLEDMEGIPNPPTTMTLSGDNLWVGGEGFIALVDLRNAKVRNFSRIYSVGVSAGVNRIEIGGGYVWAQFNKHLYRIALSELK